MEQENIIEEPKKKSYWKKIIIILGILIILIACYMFLWIHKWITLEEMPIIYEPLPSNFNGLKIVHFSDIHYGKTNYKGLALPASRIFIFGCLHDLSPR